MSELPEVTQDPNVCREQKQRTLQVEKESRKMANRLERDRVAQVFQLTVFAFNCDDARHKEPHTFHMDYCAGGGRFDVPNALQTVIKSLEHALAELKKRMQ